ncbi:response regulator [Hyalangium gracile]|uniref:response regulator n=1 Tax=Hyalangium gracile TaxID=394092 RepID=UPI001CC9F0E0|nr:response regulator [Hyalangium gracile]
MVRTKLPSFLFVDQDPQWLAALRRASRDLPGPKHFARSAEEAMDLLRAHEPAVVVSGYGLPEEDGLSLLERMKEEDPRVACVLHTAHPPRLLPGTRGIALVEKGTAPGMLQAVLNALWVALTGRSPTSVQRYLM